MISIGSTKKSASNVINYSSVTHPSFIENSAEPSDDVHCILIKEFVNIAKKENKPVRAPEPGHIVPTVWKVSSPI